MLPIVISEYGELSVWPKAVPLAGHTEYSIRFDHLQQVARKLQLETGYASLTAWMGIDESVPVLRNNDGCAIARLLMPALNLPQPLRPWLVIASMLRAWLGERADALRHRGFVPLGTEGLGFSPSEFRVLTLEAPAFSAPRSSPA